MNKIKYYVAVFVVLLLGFFWLRHRDRKIDRSTSSTVLAPGIQEKLIVNPDTHKLTIVLPSGSQELFLPDRPSSIEIDKNGRVIVTAKKWGSELKMFGGIQASDAFRLAVGIDGLYYKRLDLGLGIADKIGNYVPVGFGKVSYNFWSHLQAGLTYDTEKKAGLALTVRF